MHAVKKSSRDGNSGKSGTRKGSQNQTWGEPSKKIHKILKLCLILYKYHLTKTVDQILLNPICLGNYRLAICEQNCLRSQDFTKTTEGQQNKKPEPHQRVDYLEAKLQW